MFVAVVWISLVSHIHSGYGLSQHIPYERTRYVSGRNQIYASVYSPSLEYPQKYIPFVHFWEKPLQALETSMNVPKRLSSRPLFSWDLPVPMSTYIPTRKPSPSSSESQTTTQETTTQGKNRKLVDDNSVPFPPEVHETTRSDRLHRAKDTQVYHSKKRKSSNRKKSIEEYPQAKMIKWKDEEERMSNESPFKETKKKKKKGRKNRKEKTNGKRIKTEKKGSKDDGNEIRKTGNGAEYLDRKLINKRLFKEKQKMVLADEEPKKEKKSPCDELKDKCEHLCKEEDGRGTCVCYKGFTSLGNKCLDINECATNNGGCNGRCINTIGSRKCLCSPGFRLVDGACADINECLLRNGHGPCQDRCTNTLGGYYCSCEGLPGTTLSSDNHTCEDTSRCDKNNAGCSHTCISLSGTAFCTCPDGLELGEDWKTCHDIDECSNPDDYNVECEFGCINTIGSYHCAPSSSSTSFHPTDATTT